METLFETRLEIASISNQVYVVQAQPEITQEPVVRGDNPVDRSGMGYQTVLKENGIYRMWYQAFPEDLGVEDGSSIGYAESDDGITWRKPDLKLGLSENLCDLKLHSPSVFIDPDSSSSHRYRAVGYGRQEHVGGPEGSPIHGFYTAHSSDGLHWEVDQLNPQWDSADVISAVYHPGRQQGVIAVKFRSHRGEKFKRGIYHATFSSGVWSEAHASLIPDDFDEVCAISRGFASGDYYGMNMLPVGNESLVGFISNFRHSGPYSKNGYGIYGIGDITLAFQANQHSAWIHAPGRKDFVSYLSIPWARGGIFSAGSILEVGDENRFYFGGANRSHGWQVDDDRNPVEKRFAQIRRDGHVAIGYASWPKGRIFGLRSDPEGTVELNLDSLTEPSELILNYDTTNDGSVRVELFEMDPPREWQPPKNNLAGHSLEEAILLKDESFDATVQWKNGSVIKPVPGKRVLARIHLDCAAIYGFEVRPI
jgi:hypothetical protein